jgi:transposase
MGSTRRSFTDEYRASAVSFVLDDGRMIKDVAKGIGVHEMTLGKWVKKVRDERGESDKDRPLSIDEREELTRLRAENRELLMKVEFAKK